MPNRHRTRTRRRPAATISVTAEDLAAWLTAVARLIRPKRKAVRS